MFRTNIQKIKLTAAVMLAFVPVVLAHYAYGQAMTSSKYQIQSDSINFGGVRSDSGAYALEDTMGELATGISSSTNYTMFAGYQQMQETVITVTPATDIVMSPAFGGMSGGTSNGSTSFKVITDNVAGYQATMESVTSPALKTATDSFADYVPAGANPDFSFVNGTTQASFGYTLEGTDIPARFRDNGVVCGSGSSDSTDACWDGLSTSAKNIATRSSGNQPAGTVTSIKFRAASGAERMLENGEYTATAIVTIIPN